MTQSVDLLLEFLDASLDRSPIVLNLTRDRFAAAMREAEWRLIFVRRRGSEVRDINRVHAVGIYSNDGYLLFSVDSMSAERARAAGTLVLMNRTSDGFQTAAELQVR